MSKLEVREIGPISGETEVRLAEGATAVGFGGGGLASVQTFTSSGTWTKPEGITKVMVEVQGAGGGGGGVKDGGTSQGGGGGGYARKLIDVSSISTATITVGSGGTAGYGSGQGGTGGDSIWDDGLNIVTGGGSIGGANPPNGGHVNAPKVTGGTHSGGDWGVIGGSTSGRSVYEQAGGGSFFASTNYSTGVINNQTAGLSFGQGGAGTNRSGNTGASGAGFAGVVIVTEYT